MADGTTTRFFRPKEDITAYEVAFILAHIPGNPIWSIWKREIIFSPEQWADLPEQMQRHFADHP